MEKKFTIKEYSELFLKEIYDVAQENGVSHPQSIYEIGKKLGLKDESKIENIYEILEEQNLVKEITQHEDGDKDINISGLGEHFIETDGETGILSSVKESVIKFIDNSVKISGDNYGQAFTHSSNVNQYLRIENIQKIDNSINQIRESIVKDSTLSGEVKTEVLQDIENIKNELHKKNPHVSIVKPILEKLSKIASISTAVLALLKELNVL